MGDPAGIGAEVTAKALMDESIHAKCRPFVVGNASAMSNALGFIGNGAATHLVHSLDEVIGDAGAIDVLDIENLDFDSIAIGELSADGG